MRKILSGKNVFRLKIEKFIIFSCRKLFFFYLVSRKIQFFCFFLKLLVGAVFQLQKFFFIVHNFDASQQLFNLSGEYHTSSHTHYVLLYFDCVDIRRVNYLI